MIFDEFSCQMFPNSKRDSFRLVVRVLTCSVKTGCTKNRASRFQEETFLKNLLFRFLTGKSNCNRRTYARFALQ